MNYNKTKIKEGITIHNIQTNKFKTNLYAVFLAMPMNRENVTKNALIAAILRRGTNNIKSQDKISKKLEEMYGASFDWKKEKTGDNHILKFYLEALNEKFLPTKEELTKQCIDLLFDIIFNPLVENNGFKREYVDNEKKNLKQIIESKIDDKRRYSFERCVEEMFKNEPYGLYRYGYIEDLENITPKSLYEYYIQMINECKIDIFASGELEQKEINNIITNNEEIIKLKERNAKYVPYKEQVTPKHIKDINTIEEHKQVGQGNLVIGLSANSNIENARYITSVYNAILGGGANSKLFQNVREKESLAYTASSTYRRQKDAIFIRCGIEIANYEKTLKTIEKQIEDIKNGKFTEEDVKSSKELIISTIRSINAEQDTEITYYYGQELSEKFVGINEYLERINKVKKEDIEKVAKDIEINTVYFLRD